MKTLKNYASLPLKRPMILFGLMAAILYSSWPLGFIFNPGVANHALASQLEASHQPYNWLFISMDVASGVALIIWGIARWLKSFNRTIKLSIVVYMAFATSVIVAAFVPFNCNTVIKSCYESAHSPLFIIHGLASIVSVAFLFISVLLILKALFEIRAPRWLNSVVLSVIACWALTAMAALFIVKYHRTDENMLQDAFITICSLSLIVSVAITEYLMVRNVKPIELESESLLKKM